MAIPQDVRAVPRLVACRTPAGLRPRGFHRGLAPATMPCDGGRGTHSVEAMAYLTTRSLGAGHSGA